MAFWYEKYLRESEIQKKKKKLDNFVLNKGNLRMSDHNEPPKRETLNEKQFPGTKVNLQILNIQLSQDV